MTQIHTLNDDINKYDALIVIGNYEETYGTNWVLKEIYDKSYIRVGIADSGDKCANISFNNNTMIIIDTWGYEVNYVFGINF